MELDDSVARQSGFRSDVSEILPVISNRDSNSFPLIVVGLDARDSGA